MAHHHHSDHADSEQLAELLDLDAEVLHAHLSDTLAWLRELVGDRQVGRVLDVGTGTGAGALALAGCFPSAEVIALDMSDALLDRLRHKARELGVADRVHAVQVNLDDGWPASVDPASVDLVWAAKSLHHMADPDRVLADISGALRPGGLLTVAELDSFPRFLPDDTGHGPEARWHALMADEMAAELPHLGSDWGSRLRGAGFTVEAERTFTIELTSPLPAATGRYAQVSLRRLRSGLDDRVDDGDRAMLDALVADHGPDSVLHRDDLVVRAERTVLVARRPS
jgi:ubiquinone/menaquinone biosynthesis C-methylase UbiE